MCLRGIIVFVVSCNLIGQFSCRGLVTGSPVFADCVGHWRRGREAEGEGGRRGREAEGEGGRRGREEREKLIVKVKGTQ